MKTKNTENQGARGITHSPVIKALTRGKYFLMRHRRAVMITALLATVALLVVPHLAFAEDPAAATTSPWSSPEMDKMYREITRFITFIISFLQKLIWPLLLLIGGLMKNDILFGAGMEDRMLAIWVQIRNLVNILFVLVLLGIAFYNVIGGSNQSFQMKTILPKFVIGLIAVNFSFIGVKLVIDTVGVMTTAIFALPASIQGELGDNPINDKNFQNTICFGLYGTDDYKQNVADAGDSALCDAEGATLKQEAKQFFAKFDSNNAGIVMAVNLAKITEWETVNTGVKDFKTLALNSLFSIVLFIVFATAYVALFIVLLIRLIVLWVTLVLSPLIVLTYVLPENLAGSMGGGDLKTKFVKNAIAPLPIALMMTIGFLMLKGLQESKFTVLSNITLGASSPSLGFFTSGLSTLQEVIIAAGTVAVIWMGVFEAAKGTYADGAVNKVRGLVEGAGKFAATAFKYAPMFPVYTGTEKPGEKPEKMSLAAGMGIMENLPRSMETEAQQQSQRAVDRILKKDLFANQQLARDATSVENLIQAGVNQGPRGGADKEFQQTFGRQLRQNATWQTNLDFLNLKDEKGNDYPNAKAFVDALFSGTVPIETFDKFIRDNQTKFPGMTPQSAQPQKKEGEPSAVQVGDHRRAKNLLDEGASNEARLTEEQKVKVKAYRVAMGNKDKDAANKAYAEMFASGAINALSTMNEDTIKFRGRAKTAAGQATPAALNAEIEQRRGEIKAANKDMKDDDVDQILRTELDSVIASNTTAVQESAKDQNTGVGRLNKQTPIKSTPTATTALEEQTGNTPAAGKKPAAGTSKKDGSGATESAKGTKPAAAPTNPAKSETKDGWVWVPGDSSDNPGYWK